MVAARLEAERNAAEGQRGGKARSGYTRLMRSVLAALFGPFAAALLAQVPPPGAIATEVLVVTGRCVDADSGEPLQRCRVQLTGHQSTGYPISWARSDWADPAEQTTGGDGRFRFELRLPASDEALDRGRYHLNVAHPRHASWFSHCSFVVAMECGGGVEYGDVRLPKGVWPRVRCVDRAGALQPGVWLHLRATHPDPAWTQTPADGPHSWVTTGAFERTDVDGCLHVAAPVPAGVYTLEVREREAVQVPAQVALPSKDAAVAVVATLDSTTTIRGHLFDEAGLPIGAATLRAAGDGPTAVTGRDGAFTLLPGKSGANGSVAVQLGLNRRYDGWQQLAILDWGTQDATLVVPTAVRHTFVVRTAAGAAVERLSLYCLPASWRPHSGIGERGGVRLAGTFTAGRVECQLPPGDYQLLVAPLDARLASTDWQPITVEHDRTEIAVTVSPNATRAVELLFADGTPAAGARVEVITGAQPEPFAWVCPATAIEELRTRQLGSLVVAAAYSDEHGRVALQLQEPGAAFLRVSGPSVRTIVQAANLSPADQPARLTVERGAVLTGSVGPAATLLALDVGRDEKARVSIYDYHRRTAPTLTVVYDGGRQRREGVRIDTRGNFRCEGLPPGPVEVRLAHWVKVGDNGHRRSPNSPSLGTFTLDVAQPLHVTLQVAAPDDFDDDGGKR